MSNIYFVINDISMPGGLVRVTLNIYQQLVDKYSNKYSVKIITATTSYPDSINNFDIISLEMPKLHGQSKYHKVLWYILFSFKIKKFLKSSNADVVIGIGTMINLCISTYFNKNFKIVATEHGAYQQKKGVLCFIRKVLYEKVDTIISLTEADAKLYRLFHPQVISIPNFTTFYDNTDYSPLNSKNILCIGRFTRQKGVNELISFMHTFFLNNQNWKLILIGEGPLEAEIINNVRQLDLEKNIIIKKPTTKIKEEYLNASIYLMPSKTEGFPMVLLEAKSFGIPIVSFDCPTGPSEIIKDGEDGFLIPLGDHQMFLDKLQLLTSDQTLRNNMGKKSLLNVKEFYPDKIMPKWVKILDE